jgi:hypothetical protein
MTSASADSPHGIPVRPRRSEPRRFPRFSGAHVATGKPERILDPRERQGAGDHQRTTPRHRSEESDGRPPVLRFDEQVGMARTCQRSTSRSGRPSDGAAEIARTSVPANSAMPLCLGTSPRRRPSLHSTGPKTPTTSTRGRLQGLRNRPRFEALTVLTLGECRVSGPHPGSACGSLLLAAGATRYGHFFVTFAALKPPTPFPFKLVPLSPVKV